MDRHLLPAAWLPQCILMCVHVRACVRAYACVRALKDDTAMYVCVCVLQVCVCFS
jgi:hypothetical protein